MPSAITAAVAWLGAGLGGGVGAFLIMNAEAIAIGSLAVGGLATSGYAQRRAQARANAAFRASLKDRELTLRSAISPRRYVYGRDRVSGPLVYAETTGTNKEHLHLVIALAAHECDAIEQVWFGDQLLPEPDASGYITSGPFFKGITHANAAFRTVSGGTVTLAHNAARVIGITYTLGGDNGMEDLAGWSHSPGSNTITGVAPPGGVTSVLVDYEWTEGQHRVRIKRHLGQAGQTADADLVSESDGKWTAAHKGTGVCYVYVRLQWDADIFGSTGVPEIKCVLRGRKLADPRTATVVWSDNAALAVADWLQRPEGLRATSAQVPSAEVIDAANVCDEVVDLDAMAMQTQPRYTINSSFTADRSPRDVLDDLLQPMAGTAVWVQGRWLLRPGAHRTAAAPITPNMLAGAGVSIQPKASRGELINAVRATYRDPAQGWAEVQAPVVTNAMYEAEDGGVRRVRDIQLDSAMDALRAQRLAKIVLERARQGMTVQLSTNLSGYDYAPTDVVPLQLPRYGWGAGKEFEVFERTYTADGPIGYLLRETAAGVWAWNYGDATTVDLAPDTALPNPYLPPEPLTGLAVASGTNYLLRQLDGTIMTRAYVTWDESQDAFVRQGGKIELQWREVATDQWQDEPALPGDSASAFVAPVPDGVLVIFRVRQVNAVGKHSDWTSLMVRVLGKTQPPSDVTNFGAISIIAGIITHSWDACPDIDYSHTEVRLADSDWGSDTVQPAFRGKATDWKELVTATGTYVRYARHVDTSGNVSVGSATMTLDVEAEDLAEGSAINSYMIEIYTQAATQPATPQGGQYTFTGDVFVPPPGGWSRTLPTGTAAPTWVSRYLVQTTTRNIPVVIPGSIPSIVAYAEQASAGANVTVPTHLAGDLLVVMLRGGSGTTPPAIPSGWDSLAQSSLTYGNGWRVIAREDDDNSITSLSSAWANQIAVVVVRGGTVGAVAVGAENLQSASETLPALTLQTPGASIVLAGVMSNQGNTHTAPAGMTLLGDNLSSPSLSGGTWSIFGSDALEPDFTGRSSTWTGDSAYVSSWAVEISGIPGWSVPTGLAAPSHRLVLSPKNATLTADQQGVVADWTPAVCTITVVDAAGADVTSQYTFGKTDVGVISALSGALGNILTVSAFDPSTASNAYNNTVLQLPLDGNARDVSKYGRTAAGIGAAISWSGSGVFGGAAAVDGTQLSQNCRIIFGHHNGFVLQGGQWSTRCRVKFTNLPADIGNSHYFLGNSFRQLYVTKTGVSSIYSLSFYWNTPQFGGLTVAHSFAIATNVWYLVEFSYCADNKLRLFVDGSVVATSHEYVGATDRQPPYADGLIPCTSFSVGCSDSSGFSNISLMGLIDDVRYVIGPGGNEAAYTPEAYPLPTSSYASAGHVDITATHATLPALTDRFSVNTITASAATTVASSIGPASVTVQADWTGAVTSYAGAVATFSILVNGSEQGDTWTVTGTPSVAGITWTKSGRTITVTGFPTGSNAGRIDFIASSTGQATQTFSLGIGKNMALQPTVQPSAPAAITVAADSTGTVPSGNLPVTAQATVLQAATNVTTSYSWSVTGTTGLTASVNSSGLVSLTGMTQAVDSGTLTLTGTRASWPNVVMTISVLKTKLLLPSGAVVNPMPAITVYADSSGTAYARVRYNTNGTIDVWNHSSEAWVAAGNWYNPATADIGDDHYLRMVSGTIVGTVVGARDVWLAMDTDRIFEVETPGGGTYAQMSGTALFSATAGGAILGQGPVNLIAQSLGA